MGQHTPIPPDDCTSCRLIFSALAEHAEAGGGRLLAVDLGTRVGLRDRALRVHLAYLHQHRRIQADRRTPVAGATVQPAAPPLPANSWPLPLDWAVTVECPDRMCRRMLLLHAREADAAWGGQMGLQETAEALGCSWRTAQTHRRHLVDAGLLRVTADTAIYPSGHPIRRPDRYQLLSGRQVPVGASYDEDTAILILDEVPWWPGAAPGETHKAVRRLLRHARNGWPAEKLVERLKFEPRSPVISRISLLREMLPKLDQPYVPPAAEAVGAAIRTSSGRLWLVCPQCDRPYSQQAQAHVREGQLCRDCAPYGAAWVPIVHGNGEPAF